MTTAFAVLAQTMPIQQWRHGVALCAQEGALKAGYGRPTVQLDRDFPNGFTLDDLNSVYSDCAGWDNLYASLKSLETSPADNAALLQLAEHTVSGSGMAVDSAMNAYALSTRSHAAKADSVCMQRQPQQSIAANAPILPVLVALSLLVALACGLTAVVAIRKVGQLRKDLAFADARIAAIEQGLQTVSAEVQRNMPTPAVAACGATDGAAPVTAAPAEPCECKQKPSPRVLYMSRPDSGGVFMRSSSVFEAGNSIFRLVTPDGSSATFDVIDDENVHRLALMMPTENLTTACDGESIQMSHGKNRIVTDVPGEAVLDGGKWRIVRRAVIHYE